MKAYTIVLVVSAQIKETSMMTYMMVCDGESLMSFKNWCHQSIGISSLHDCGCKVEALQKALIDKEDLTARHSKGFVLIASALLRPGCGTLSLTPAPRSLTA